MRTILMNDLFLETEHLCLYPCPREAAEAAYEGQAAVERVLGLRTADDWLDQEARALLTYYFHWLTSDPSLYGWGLWLIEHRQQHVVFGTIGFKGQPDRRGSIEIGYGIAASFRRQGYTFEAARALVDWALAQPQVKQIVAECLLDNRGSIRILEKLGMQRTGIDDEYIKWKLKV